MSKKKPTILEMHYEGLMASMQHARNRLIFFILFATYSFLSILGTTDKMLFMEKPINMPLLNIELPLLAFYIVMPVFLLFLSFNLLYTFNSHQIFLLNINKKHKKDLKFFPIGVFEGALLNQDTFHIFVRTVIRTILFVFPLVVLVTFWFRFSDFQSFLISLWHFILILISIFFTYQYRYLLVSKRSFFNKKKKNIAFILVVYTLFVISIGLYQFLIIYPLSEKSSKLNKIQSINSSFTSFFKNNPKVNERLLPRIILRNQILIPTQKDQIEILQELQGNKNETLLRSVPQQNRSNRNFRLAIINDCILPNVNFENSQLQMIEFTDSQLQGANFHKANLQKAKFQGSTNLQNASFTYANLNYAMLWFANLQKANLYGAKLHRAQMVAVNLQGADLTNSELQGADLTGAKLTGASMGFARLQGSILTNAILYGVDMVGAQLQRTDLTGIELQGADLSGAQLQGAKLFRAKLHGTILRNTQLQGVSSDNKEISTFRENKTDLTGISVKRLTQKNVDSILTDLKIYLRPSIIKNHFYQIKERLNSVIDKDPITLVTKQNIQTGSLSKEDFEKISKEIAHPTSRKNSPLPPVNADGIMEIIIR